MFDKNKSYHFILGYSDATVLFLVTDELQFYFWLKW